jgi:hypothetical protein
MGLMSGHSGGTIVHDNGNEIGVVPGAADKGGNGGMKEGRITDYR